MRPVSQITIHLRRFSRSSIRVAFNVRFFRPLPRTDVFSSTDGLITTSTSLSTRPRLCSSAPPPHRRSSVSARSFKCPYTHDEKVHTAPQFLLHKQLTQNGLSEAHVQLTEPALLQTVTHYTREAGVRSLERAIGGIVYFKAVEWAAHVDAPGLPRCHLPRQQHRRKLRMCWSSVARMATRATTLSLKRTS